MKILQTLQTVSIALLAIGCASAPPPKELRDARDAYAEARLGEAPQMAPVALHQAAVALERAEASHRDDGESRRTRDLAYVAMRRAQEAQAWTRVAMAQRARDAHTKELSRLQAIRESRTRAALSSARSQLSTTFEQLREQQRQTAQERTARAQTEERLEAQIGEERQARAATEQQLQEQIAAAERDARIAVESLRQIANAREEARGVVVTLSGSVLFATGESTLLPIAESMLDDVATALEEQTGNRTIRVEGHTDSRGSARRNEELSQRRAESVRQHLVSRGVPADRIRAVGRGASRPVADNGTAEGRANNRRVEIVIEPTPQPSQ